MGSSSGLIVSSKRIANPEVASNQLGQSERESESCMSTFVIPESKIRTLEKDPTRGVMGQMGNVAYQLRVALPNYAESVAAHYTDGRMDRLQEICDRAAIPFEFSFFGLECTFFEPYEVQMYDDDMTMQDDLRILIKRFGPVIVKNAYLAGERREDGHRAKFKHLNFHYDRRSHQDEQHSLYFRDPFDPIQAEPRESSTLFIANIVALLQWMKETGQTEVPEGEGVRGTYQIFEGENMEEVIGNIILEHRWDEPRGTGELSSLDNRTVLHASYYRTPSRNSYPIGVRYLK